MEFTAKYVSYEEALDGDIIQVSFDEYEDDDPFNPTALSLGFSINYEIPPRVIEFVWCDGEKYDGGVKAQKYSLSKNELVVLLDTGDTIKVNFSCDKRTYEKIETLLNREIGGHA